MRCSRFSWFALIALMMAIGVMSVAAETKPDKDLEIIARVSANILGREHYRRRELDAEMASALFEEYFRLLDPARSYFSQEDLAVFEPQRAHLGEQLLQGDLSFPFAVHHRFVEKLVAYRDFARQLLAGELALDTDEEMVLDRSKLPWLPERELRDVWRHRLMNDVLILRLMERAAAEEAAQKTPGGDAALPAPWGQKAPPERVSDRAMRVWQLMSESDAVDVIETYLTSLANVYDPHSAYMSPGTVEDFNIQMRLSLAGVGAVLKTEDGYTQVVRVIDGGPAARDGRLQPEDRIIAVAQGAEEPVDVVDMPLKKVVQKIRGKVGTEVRLTILSAKQGVAAIPTVIALTRDEVKLTEQEAKGEVRELPLPGGGVARVGIIDLPSFYVDFAAAYRGQEDYKSSTRDVRLLLEDFQRERKLDGLILDLRRNGGGGLGEAIQLTGLFLPQGPVVQVRHANGRIEVKNDEDASISYAGPLVVMVNRLSASAAEIFAAAIQDHGRGVIVGDDHTHGKGTVQSVLELDPILRHYGLRRQAGSMKLTTAMFYRINGDSTQERGVIPDIVLPSYTDLMEIGEQYLDHALPWGQIPSAQYTADTALSTHLGELRERSATRRAASPKFKLLAERIESYRQFRERKTVSLNVERRWQTYLDEKRMLDEQLRMIRLDEEDDDDDDKPEQAREDLLLDECLAVILDFLQLLRTPPETAAR